MASPIPIPASAGILGQPSVQLQAAPVVTGSTLPAQQVPQTGLIGSEQALGEGYQGALGAMTQGTNQAANILGQVAANSDYSQIKQPELNYSANTSVGANIKDPLNQAAGNFEGYLGGGTNAAKLQADLSGANGQAAQQAAYAQYQSSPAMKYQMDQMQRATERSAAARGGALGGNVLLELQRNAAGIASQDYQNQFNNLGQVAGQGLNAAGQIAGLKSTEAGIAGQLQSAGMQAEAALAGQKYGAQMNLLGQTLDQKNRTMTQLADLASSHGLNIAGLKTGYASALSSGRTTAGQNIAQNATNAATNIGNLLSQQGLNISNEMANDISTTTKMLYDYGMQDKISNENLAAMIANITSGQATNTQNAYANIGAANAAGTMGVANAVQGGLTQGLMLGMLGGGNPAPAYNPNASTSFGMLGAGSNMGAYA